MKKKLITLFLLPILLTSCKKNTDEVFNYEQAKNYIIENYTFNKASYLYMKGTYSIEMVVKQCQGIYPNAQNSNGDYVFSKSTIKEGDSAYTSYRSGRSELDVLNYEELNDSFSADKKVNIEKIEGRNIYTLENECLTVAFKGTDKIDKILNLSYLDLITNSLSQISYDKNFDYEVEYKTNEVGLFSTIKLNLHEEDTNSNGLNVDYTMTFNWNRKQNGVIY